MSAIGGTRKHLLNTIKIGIYTLIPIAILVYVFRLVIGFAIDVGEIFTDNWIVALLIVGAIGYVVGLIIDKTTVVARLREKFAANPFALRLLNFLPTKRHNSDNQYGEAVIYLDHGLRVRVEIVGEYSDDEGDWWIVQIGSPPLPRTGMMFEVNKSNPRIVRTGRNGMDYAQYIISYSAAIRH
ncbi:hypothetical protein HY967_02045 [Candidatus Jorgensenbacteria bacterium]|nr:hypothetical protein [Candidatus Jorgensenbacteria bacterium]